jgi:predicted DNA-binding protein
MARMAEMKTTIRIDEDLWHRLRVVAVEERKTASEIIREFVTWYVEKKEAERV